MLLCELSIFAFAFDYTPEPVHSCIFCSTGLSLLPCAVYLFFHCNILGKLTFIWQYVNSFIKTKGSFFSQFFGLVSYHCNFSHGFKNGVNSHNRHLNWKLNNAHLALDTEQWTVNTGHLTLDISHKSFTNRNFHWIFSCWQKHWIPDTGYLN